MRALAVTAVGALLCTLRAICSGGLPDLLSSMALILFCGLPEFLNYSLCRKCPKNFVEFQISDDRSHSVFLGVEPMLLRLASPSLKRLRH